MVCSACGYENQAGMHFCGMCGTPLPHRPLTTPGAQSTLSMTRVPVDGGSRSHDHTLSNLSGRAGVLDMPAASHAEVRDVPHGDWEPSARDLTGAVPEQEVPSIERPAKELVPDVPLHEYLQATTTSPEEPDEKTMRSDTTVVDAADPVAPTPANLEADASAAPLIEEPAAAAAPMISASHAEASRVVTETTAPIENLPVTPADSVVSRLGLEPQGPAETPVERPRFLDIHEQPSAKRARPPRLPVLRRLSARRSWG